MIFYQAASFFKSQLTHRLMLHLSRQAFHSSMMHIVFTMITLEVCLSRSVPTFETMGLQFNYPD